MKYRFISVSALCVMTAMAFSWVMLSCAKSEVMEMALIPEGEYMMGGVDGAKTKVKISRFYIGVYEVTQKQYQSVMGENPSHFRGKADNPVENVDWYNAVLFCNKLSEISGYRPYYTIDRTGKDPENNNGYDEKRWHVTVNDGANGFRLPTSAEWEYACRAGTATTYYWGESVEFPVVDQYAVYEENSRKKGEGHADYGTHPKGTRKPNAWGLYDMTGNVNEWCYDWHPRYYGTMRVSRGGSWADFVGPLSVLQAGKANWYYPINNYDFAGFRIARSL